MKSNAIRKLCLSIVLAGITLMGQNVWACEKPNVNTNNYWHVNCLHEGLAEVIGLTSDRRRGQAGYMDKDGNIIIPMQYAHSSRNFSDGLAAVAKTNIDSLWGLEGSLWGFIDKTGKVVIPLKYNYANDFKEGFATVVLDEKYGVIDKTGKEIIPIQYKDIKYLSNGLFWIKKGDAYALMNSQHQAITPFKYELGAKRCHLFGCEYDSFEPLKDRPALKTREKNSTKDADMYLSFVGKLYDVMYKLEEGLSLVGLDGKYGYVDKTGKEFIPLIYQDAHYFSENSSGLAAVKKDGKWGYIDTNGKVVINFQYEYVESFNNGKARVAFGNDGKTPEKFYIDKTGKILTTRTSLADFRKKLEQGDDIFYKTNDDSGYGMIFEIKGNLVQVQTKESQCTQRDHRGDCQNYIENQVGKWVKKSEVYPSNHFD